MLEFSLNREGCVMLKIQFSIIIFMKKQCAQERKFALQVEMNELDLLPALCACLVFLIQFTYVALIFLNISVLSGIKQ